MENSTVFDRFKFLLQFGFEVLFAKRLIVPPCRVGPPSQLRLYEEVCKLVERNHMVHAEQF